MIWDSELLSRLRIHSRRAGACAGDISLVDILEAAPPELAARAVQELPEERILGGTWALLREAVRGLKPKVLCRDLKPKVVWLWATCG